MGGGLSLTSTEIDNVYKYYLLNGFLAVAAQMDR